MTLVNSTLTGNSGPTFINTGASATATLGNSTLTGNTATGTVTLGALPGGRNPAALRVPSGTVHVNNTILVGNGPLDVSGFLRSDGHNIVGTDDSNNFHEFGRDQTGVSVDQLKFGALADNGGPTQTIAIGAGSIAINQGGSGVDTSSAPTDQRGVARPVGRAPDVGAFEFDARTDPGFTESLEVTTLTDEDDGTSDKSYGTGTSLREALGYAMTLANGTPVVTFAPDLSGTITLTQNSPLNISSNVRVVGPVAATDPGGAPIVPGSVAGGISVDGHNATLIFDISGGTVELSNLTLNRGFAGRAGAIVNAGTLTCAVATSPTAARPSAPVPFSTAAS